jgi:hypothetical protein
MGQNGGFAPLLARRRERDGGSQQRSNRAGALYENPINRW